VETNLLRDTSLSHIHPEETDLNQSTKIRFRPAIKMLNAIDTIQCSLNTDCESKKRVKLNQ
jgi:hypothetical protein